MFCYTPPAVRPPVLLIVLVSLCACRKPVEARLAEGDAAAVAGRWEEARSKWEAARDLSPELALTHARLGAALWHLGRNAEAVTAWQRAVELDATCEDAVEGLARSALAVGDAGAALTVLSTVVDPASLTFKRVQVRALLARGADGDADAAMTIVSGLGDAPESIYLLGSTQIALKRYSDAQATLDGLARAHPKSPLGSYGLARLAAAQSRQTDALLNLSAARAAAGADWRPVEVAADPAFAFLATTPEFKALVGP